VAEAHKEKKAENTEHHTLPILCLCLGAIFLMGTRQDCSTDTSIWRENLAVMPHNIFRRVADRLRIYQEKSKKP
jgi:hypothetical protein